MAKPHIARTFAPSLQLPGSTARGARVWGVWANKRHYLSGSAPLSWSLHCAFIRTTVRDLNAGEYYA